MSAIGAGNTGGPRRERRSGASVTLRRAGEHSADAAGPGDMMDPAERSLADALRITYRLLQAAMLVILAVYLLSGFQSVKESERGLRLLFGRIQNDNLASGFQFAMPEPIGELIHVSTGEEKVQLKKEFFPNLTQDEEGKLAKDGAAGLVGTGSNVLDPEADGMLLTSDGNIVHARVELTYRRDRPGDFARNIATDPDRKPTDPTIESLIVANAARRGMITAAAGASMDEFLKNQPDPGRKNFRPVDEVAKGIAQQALDELRSGITIQQFSVLTRMPPRHTLSDFNRVQAAQSEASRAIQEAEGARRETLNQAAGEGAEALLAKIDEYERELESGKTSEAARVLGELHAIMLRQSSPGGAGQAQVVPAIFGKVAQTISEAEQYRTQVVTRARADATVFRVKREAYLANPAVFIASEWTDAIGKLLNRDGVQVMQVPNTLERLVVLINRDPEIAREQERARKEAEAKAAQEERLRQRIREQNERRFDPAGE